MYQQQQTNNCRNCAAHYGNVVGGANGLECGLPQYGCQPQQQAQRLLYHQLPDRSVSNTKQSNWLLVLLVICLTIVLLLFVSFLVLVGTDNALSRRFMADEESRQQSQRLIIHCRPCRPIADAETKANVVDTSPDDRCCQLDADLHDVMQKVRC